MGRDRVAIRVFAQATHLTFVGKVLGTAKLYLQGPDSLDVDRPHYNPQCLYRQTDDGWRRIFFYVGEVYYQREVFLPKQIEIYPSTVESDPGLVGGHDEGDDEGRYDTRGQPDIIIANDVVVEDSSDAEGLAERTGARKGLEGCFET